MESYRIYKSLPVDDFMSMTAFVMAKTGIDLTPLIQETNFIRKREHHTGKFIKERFIADVKKEAELYRENMSRDIHISELGKFYMFVPIKKEDENDQKMGYSIIPEFAVFNENGEYVDWFNTMEEAQQYIKDTTQAAG